MEAVALKGPTPQIRSINYLGDRYVKGEDVVAWLMHLADNLVDETETDPRAVAGQSLLADQIRILATFTTERLSV